MNWTTCVEVKWTYITLFLQGNFWSDHKRFSKLILEIWRRCSPIGGGHISLVNLGNSLWRHISVASPFFPEWSSAHFGLIIFHPDLSSNLFTLLLNGLDFCSNLIDVLFSDCSFISWASNSCFLFYHFVFVICFGMLHFDYKCEPPFMSLWGPEGRIKK